MSNLSEDTTSVTIVKVKVLEQMLLAIEAAHFGYYSMLHRNMIDEETLNLLRSAIQVAVLELPPGNRIRERILNGHRTR